jgi:predicted membrane protein
MNGKQMLLATIILIIGVVVFIISYIVLAWPVEYVVDSLIKCYPSSPSNGDVSEIRPSLLTIPYFLTAAFVIGIFLLFVWYFAMAHKYEEEQD